MENVLPKAVLKKFLFFKLYSIFFKKYSGHRTSTKKYASKSQKFEIGNSLTRRRPRKSWNEVVEDLKELKVSKELAKDKGLKVIKTRVPMYGEKQMFLKAI